MNEPALALPADPFSTSLSGRRLGRYEVLARLASGGMAGVYVARAVGVAGFERLFAVKVLHPHLAHEEEFITMFLDEARLAARIRHPNVVPTIDISDTQDAGYYLVMDYIEGDHLGALLQKAYRLGTKLPTPITLRIMLDALEGLAAAHSLTDEHGQRINLVHRDISPHNIMVSTDGIARITDFGVAKAEVRQNATSQGQFKGKLAYMAPEQASSGESDQRSDLFSAAIVLWECLTGTRLFRAENQAATLTMICIEPIPMPSSIDPQLAPFDPVLARALARDPDQRFQTAEEFAEAIEESIEALGGLANQRTVAKLVRDYAAEKIDGDRELIRSAIAELGSGAEPEPVRPAVDSSPAAVFKDSHAPSQDPVPVAIDEPATRKRPLVLVGSLIGVAIALGVATWLMGGEEPTVTSSPLPPATKAIAPPPPPIANPLPPATSAPAAQTPTTTEAAGAKPKEQAAAPVEARPKSTTATRPRRSAPSPAPAKSEKPRPAKPPSQQDLLLNPYRR